MIQHIYSCRNHNEVRRLRRISKQMKVLIDAYLRTPKPGHQGKWVLKMDSRKDNILEQFLEMGLPPASRLYIANEAELQPSKKRSFFEDKHLHEFMAHYSKHVTHLKLDKLFMPLTSIKEIEFY